MSIGAEEYDGSPALMIDGVIEAGDYDKVRATTREIISSDDFNDLYVYLNSNGGDASEAMKIGRFLREMLAKTIARGYQYYDPNLEGSKKLISHLQSDPKYIGGLNFTKLKDPSSSIKEEELAKCYSACVLIFYAGTKKAMSDNQFPGPVPKSIPIIGLHRPYFNDDYFSNLLPSEAKTKYRKLELEVRQYLDEMGAPASIFERMSKTSSKDIDLIGMQEFSKLYSKEEPYYEEWLIAKCGKGGPENAFSGENLNKYKQLEADVVSELNKLGTNSGEYWAKNHKRYIPTTFSTEEAESLRMTLSSYNREVNQCGENATLTHQKAWAKKFTN